MRASLIAALVLVPLSLAAQRTSFVTTLGHDTLSFEQYTRTGDTITGDWVTTYGGIMYHHYVITLRPDGTVARYHLALHRVNGKPVGSVDMQFDADSATITTTDPDKVQRVAAANAFPVFAGTVAPYEVIARFARAHNRDSSVTRILPAFSSYRTGEAPLVFFAGDSAWLGNPAAPRYARIDRSGRIEGISARATTTRGETRRTADYDLASIISHFPDIPPDKNIVGAPGISPRDTARGQLGRATISVDYGRPAVRGRDVFARGVLGDTLWRVGANAATQFTTDRDLKFGESTLRAGTYSMWMRVTPDDSRFELVFNSQIGQWGTEHHADRDVLTVPLRRLKGSAPVERLTITLPQSGEKSGAMRIVWGTTVLATPVSVP
ncbi:MAG TPA: DUF2911 domain-containing protein [Gemmatimonadaceae bacterium]|nr:DUF2911 domain-containing protein [Gemmatimonadaceae bacterium]